MENMVSPIVSPTARSHAAMQSLPKDPLNLQSHKEGRGTPLPQYEKTQSVPFTLTLQEDKEKPGQFQLVVNVDPEAQKDGTVRPSKTPSKKLVANLQEPPSLGYDVSQLYRTQKSSPPSTPHPDSQGWSDLDAVPPQFVKEVAPDWKITFSRSNSTVSTQSRKMADIKARIKKSGKGFVVRLLKGTSADPNDVREVELGRDAAEQHSTPSIPELESAAPPAELETQELVHTAPSDVPNGVFEIGSSGEPGVVQAAQPAMNPAVSSIPQWLSQTSSGAPPSTRLSILEDNLSDAETLLPDVRSVIDRMEDHTDIEPMSNGSSVLPTRSGTVLSIVKTPTRGLSIVGPARRVEKGRVRAKGKQVRPDINRTGARKSLIGRSPQGSISRVIEAEHATDVASPDEWSDPSSRKRSMPKRRTAQDKQESSHPKARRQNSAPNSIPANQSRARLRLDTNVLPPKSVETSPATVKRFSPGIDKSPLLTRDGNVAFAGPTSESVSTTSSPAWSEVDPADDDGIRKALEEAFGEVREDLDSNRPRTEPPVPEIRAPIEDEDRGMYALPPSLEIRSAPTALGNRFSMFWGLALGAVLDKAVEGLQHLRDSYGNEPALAPGHVRVRWTCPCGEQLYDDFIERRPGAARWLEGYLNRPRTHTPSSPHSRSSTSTSMSSIFDNASRASTLATPSSTYGGPSSWGKNSKSKHSPTRVRSNNPFSVAIGRTVEDSWLLTCANEGRFTPKIVHLDVNTQRIRSDKDLAMVLRDHYENINRRWLKWLRLRGLTTIEFVQFEVHRNRFADIRAAPSMPPTSSPVNDKSPSQHPYTFEAVDLMPPVGSSYLLHLFKHPEDYDGELITYLRTPKRRERLEFGMGWGINLVEGFLAQKVWAIIMIGFGVGSTVFAILWTIRKDDVQGAFGVAGWLVTLAALALGALQAWLE